MRTIWIALALWLCMPVSAQAEDWVNAGWRQIAASHHDKALAIWQQGVNQLDDKRLLASIGVYAHFPYAIAQLKTVGPGFGAFIARRQQQGRTLYFVLSVRQTPADKKIRQLLLADLKQAAGISGPLLAAAAGTFKPHSKSTDLTPPVPTHAARKSPQTARPGSDGATEPAIAFSINRFEISGNKLVSNDTLLMGLGEFYGAAKTRSDLTSIRNRIVEVYRLAGVGNVRVSKPQLVHDDTVQITIQEK